MNKLAGIGSLDRKRLITVISCAQHAIGVTEAAEVLGLPRQETAKLLSRWATKG